MIRLSLHPHLFRGNTKISHSLLSGAGVVVAGAILFTAPLSSVAHAFSGVGTTTTQVTIKPVTASTTPVVSRVAIASSSTPVVVQPSTTTIATTKPTTPSTTPIVPVAIATSTKPTVTQPPASSSTPPLITTKPTTTSTTLLTTTKPTTASTTQLAAVKTVASSTAPIAAKVSVTLDYLQPYTSAHSGAAVVKKEAFGTVYLATHPFSEYKTAVSPLSVRSLGFSGGAQVSNNSLRWPGGTFAERDPNYSLAFPDIYNEPARGAAGYDPQTQRGLTEMLAYAVEKKLAFVMVIPTRPYFNNVAQGQAHLRDFMIKLVRGDYGPLPTSMTLEIGNETASMGWANGKFTPGPGSYGYLADAFLTTINSVLTSTSLNPQKKRVDTAIWIGSTEGGMHKIYSQISDPNLMSVDGFVHHIGLVPNSNEYDFATSNRKFGIAKRYWEDAWFMNVPEMKLIATEWNVGGCAKPATPAEYLPYDIGARQAPAVVNTFSQMIGGGLDSGMLWGVQKCVSKMFWHKGKTISHGGHAYRLMAESLVGTQLLAGKVNASGLWTRSGTNYDVIGYRDGSKMVVFISAGDIPATGLDVTVTLTNFDTIKSISIKSVKTTVTGTGDISPDDDRIYEDPIVSNGTVTRSGNSFTYRLTQDYELARVIAYRYIH